MILASRWCAVFAFVVSLWPATAARAQSVAPADEARLRAEVNAFMDSYWTYFSAGQIEQLVANIYHPFGQLDNRGHSSIEQLRSRFPAARKALLDGGYGRSNMPVRNICVLAPTVAIVSGRGVRYLADGKEMAAFGWTYTLVKGEQGWRMMSIYSHDPAVALTCPSRSAGGR